MTKKNGHRANRQRYKCGDCGRQFDGGFRLDDQQLWHEFSSGKQTCKQLAQRHKCSVKTIRRHLDKTITKRTFSRRTCVNIIMDTTYFGRCFGVLVLLDAISGETLSVDIVGYETNALYHSAIKRLLDTGVHAQSIVCDGRKGLAKLFPDIPVQLWHFHQIQTINRYLTRRPKSLAVSSLRHIALTLTKVNKASFLDSLNDWHNQYKQYLN